MAREQLSVAWQTVIAIWLVIYILMLGYVVSLALVLDVNKWNNMKWYEIFFVWCKE